VGTPILKKQSGPGKPGPDCFCVAGITGNWLRKDSARADETRLVFATRMRVVQLVIHYPRKRSSRLAPPARPRRNRFRCAAKPRRARRFRPPSMSPRHVPGRPGIPAICPGRYSCACDG